MKNDSFSFFRQTIEQTSVEDRFDMAHNHTAAIRSFELFCGNELSTDLFMFSIYGRGISFTDMAYIKKSDVKGRWLTYTTQVVNPSTSTVPLGQCHAGNCQPIFVNHHLSTPYPLKSSNEEIAHRNIRQGRENMVNVMKQIAERCVLSMLYGERHISKGNR